MALPVAEVVLSVFQGLALLLTLFRVSFRVWIGRFWWEDGWAAMAFVCGLVCLITVYTHDVENKRVKFVSGWMYLYAWSGILWTVRLSCIASVVRIVQPGRLRQLILASGWLFVAMYLGLAAQKTYLCVSILEQFYKGGSKGTYTCAADQGVAISQVAADAIADMILVSLSLRVLWGVRLKRRQRRMIIAIFVSSAAVTVASINHAVSDMVSENLTWRGITTLVEIVISLVVCNLLVIVTLLYRIVAKDSESAPTTIPESRQLTTNIELGRDEVDDDYTQPRSHPRTTTGSSAWTRFLTTVELSFNDGWWTESEKRESCKDETG